MKLVVVIIKVYLIYHKNKFKGHTTDKEALNRFLKSRNKKYKIVKISKKNIDDTILNSQEFNSTELNYLTHIYGAEVLYDYPMFNYEMEYMNESIRDDAGLLDMCVIQIIEKIDFLKLKKKEYDTIHSSFNSILECIADSVAIEEEFLYDDIFDIKKYIANVIINKVD